jgi:hypothetical protein
LWPLIARVGGAGLGAAWTLPPVLHGIGLIAATYMLLRLLAMTLAGLRRPRTKPPQPAAPSHLVGAHLSLSCWKAPPNLRSTRRRSHFSLRGMPD